MKQIVVPRCEGWRRTGGAFTLGPVRWQQCENTAIVRLTVTQAGETEQISACLECWREATGREIEILEAVPL